METMIACSQFKFRPRYVVMSLVRRFKIIIYAKMRRWALQSRTRFGAFAKEWSK